MAKQLQLRRGTTTQHDSFTGAEGEVTIDTNKDTVVVHDGSTAGGFPLARADGGNTITNFRSTGIDDNSNALAITIDCSERVGIGVSDPSSKLTVNGDIETSTTGKIKQKGAFMQSSTHQSLALGY